MQAFVRRMELVFVATADSRGEADCSLRAGPAGFVQVLDRWTLAYPELRGNGVMASLGNLHENGHVGLLFVDFFRDTVGLHVNGRARVVDDGAVAKALDSLGLPPATATGARPERWVAVDVQEAYIHCSKHIPLLAKRDKAIAWGTDDVVRKGGDYFGVAGQAAARASAAAP
jgi:predicted pyridoxine 5'-phosphate oxidase superfamily flavin-nucleotide-binding protein